MTRVAVIGNAGGGKSTLGRAICAAHGLPYTEIDRLLWQPGWVATPQADFERAHEKLLAEPRWLIDGYGPWEALLTRLDAADTIVFVDHPLPVHLWWATKRQIASILFGRKDGPDGCPMLPVSIRLYRMIWWLHNEMRPKLLTAIAKRRQTKRIIHIRSPKDLNAFARNPE